MKIHTSSNCANLYEPNQWTMVFEMKGSMLLSRFNCITHFEMENNCTVFCCYIFLSVGKFGLQNLNGMLCLVLP
jgi:hypothetical protein